MPFSHATATVRAFLSRPWVRSPHWQYTLFVDVKRSTQFLLEYQSEFMFHEIQDKDADMTDAQI